MKWFNSKPRGVNRDKLLEKLWSMHDEEDKRIKMHEPMSVGWLICDGRRSAIVDLIAHIKYTT